MSDWKNPSFPNQPKRDWDKPFLFDAEKNEDKIQGGDLIKGLLAFLVIATLNALALFGIAFIADYELSYREALLVAMIYVLWRVYDTIIFSRFKKQ